MIGAVEYGDLDIDHRIASDYAVFHGSFDTGLGRSDEFFRDDAAHDLVFEGEARAGFLRIEAERSGRTGRGRRSDG